ncbi:N-terminal double-transmembrane domain-containing protein [Roseovarius tolerans]|uniref:N-terminal double-transmembrane domain-containing protein n=1 Tax=Roseovarius tolerans TaxID=74031 RepID=A0A1H8DY06_9RHOB|nr:DUF4159 domain-containing protein [Roseovarius tolerans]SEN11724.1 N-terminal double-transmembrane domain-containing protein [Roseovarius tolerans]
MMLGPIGFAAPWLLLALAALPILWIILRAVPPAPIRRRFPGVALLLGLTDDDTVTDRTPWWLLLIRMLAVAAVIVGLAGPVLNPRADGEAASRLPLLIVTDASWANARDWNAQVAVMDGLLAEAGRDGRAAAIMELSDPEAPIFRAAETWRTGLPGLTPAPWAPTPETLEAVAEMLGEDGFETRWFSDGLAHDGRDALLEALEARGPVTVHESPRAVMALRPAQLSDGLVDLTALRAVPGGTREITVNAHGLDPAGIPRVLASLPMTFEDEATETTGALSLPPELRARVTRFEIAGETQAGAVTLTDDGLKRREVALIAGREDREGLELLSPLHYLEQALVPTADLLDGALMDVLPANPDVIVLADVATLSGAEQAALLEWAEKGGLLLRFAGPRVAASDVSRSEEAPLMPVRLRAGGRTVGGAMSWGEPKALAPFPDGSPFQGLDIPGDVTVSAQVMAQPDPTLAERVIAQLTDGTPLVTRKRIGAGQVVLFHVTANAEWSSLPLSGLFVQMLERLAVSSAMAPPDMAELEGTTWQPVEVLDGFGRLDDAGTRPGVAGEDVLNAPLGPNLLPGLYDGPERRVARNVVTAETTLTPMTWPARIPVEGLARAPETPLGGWLLATALVLLTADILASLALSGRLWPARAAAVLVLALSLGAPQQAQAQENDARAIQATSEVVLAHVITGNTQVDDAARAGLRGLGRMLTFRTSIEPDPPISVNLETDELAFYPILYWPITPDQPAPSAEAYVKLNDYLRSGGMIVFDTRDADVAGFGASSPNGARLQRLAAPLDIPPLEPVPEDHVLTRTFYLLSDFPGRHTGRAVWVEAAPPDAERIEGMPFRNLNDGVTPVVIGGNDWASAWAVNERGDPLFPVGRGYAGERQRELSYRFGVNLVMHVLTGNYKSDQVHVPALLDRLGQ